MSCGALPSVCKGTIKLSDNCFPAPNEKKNSGIFLFQFSGLASLTMAAGSLLVNLPRLIIKPPMHDTDVQWWGWYLCLDFLLIGSSERYLTRRILLGSSRTPSKNRPWHCKYLKSPCFNRLVLIYAKILDCRLVHWYEEFVHCRHWQEGIFPNREVGGC